MGEHSIKLEHLAANVLIGLVKKSDLHAQSIGALGRSGQICAVWVCSRHRFLWIRAEIYALGTQKGCQESRYGELAAGILRLGSLGKSCVRG